MLKWMNLADVRKGLREMIDTSIAGYILDIIDEGSMNKASQKNQLSQSALSHNITQFEYYIGYDIFERKGRQLLITNEGTAILPQIERIADLEAKMYQLAQPIQPLKVGFSHYSLFLAYTQSYERVYPNRSIQGIVAHPHELTEKLKSGELDSVVTITPLEKNRQIQSTIFCEEPIFVCMSKAHPLAKKIRLSKREIAGETIILPGIWEDSQYFFETMMKREGLTNPILREDDPLIIKELVSSGRCLLFAFESTALIQHELMLACKRIEDISAVCPIIYSHLKGEEAQRKTAHFYQHIVSLY